MIQKRDIEKLRMKTVMSEALNAVINSPYQSIRENAELKLKFLQEEYKGIFGEYSEEHIVPVTEGTIEYKKMQIKALIADLTRLESKGATEVWVDGTLMTPSEGNYIILSSKPQM
jgi:hypothetical protein